MKIRVTDTKDEQMYELSREMYRVLYPNDKPNYHLSTDDFMRLLFVMDNLSSYPILTKDNRGETA